MAAARDQATARIIRSEPDADESELAHAAPGEQRRASPPDEPAARSAPSAPAIKKPATDAPAAANRRRAKIRQAQIRADGNRLAACARSAQLWRILHAGRAFLRLHRRRLCPRQQHPARRAGVRPHRGDPSRRQRSGSRRRRDLPDRRWRLSHRRGCGAQPGSPPSRRRSIASAARSRRWKARPSR